MGLGGAALVLLHGLALAALLSAFGSLLFVGFLVPAKHAAADRVARWSLALAIILEIAWVFGEAKFIAGAASLADTLAALPVVLRATEFGHLTLAQIAALAASLLVFRPGARTKITAALACLATALEAWLLHGAAMHPGPSPILISELLHVLAAGAWLGGLLPLALFVRAAPPASGAIAANRFSAKATLCVLVLAATAFWQGRILIGTVAALFCTAYGSVALAKLGLFVMLFAFAARHRPELAPALEAAGPRGALSRGALSSRRRSALRSCSSPP
jgi:putative copper resistance protein D